MVFTVVYTEPILFGGMWCTFREFILRMMHLVHRVIQQRKSQDRNKIIRHSSFWNWDPIKFNTLTIPNSYLLENNLPNIPCKETIKDQKISWRHLLQPIKVLAETQSTNEKAAFGPVTINESSSSPWMKFFVPSSIKYPC